jgi:NADH:ubiquinone reductase (H+-translocating)
MRQRARREKVVDRRRLIIIGGGFAGVTLAQRLERRAAADVEIILISSENHIVFTPLLSEVVGRSISPLHVVVAGRRMLRRARWLTSRVTGIDFKNHLVHHGSPTGKQESLSYDHLILACGSVVNLDYLPGLAAYAHPLKTLGDAIFLGNDLIARLEEAADAPNQTERARLLTVVVIGGGFTGVEIAGEVADMMDRVRRYYPELRDEAPRIVLLVIRGAARDGVARNPSQRLHA